MTEARAIDHLNVATLNALPDDAPVTMLNLMRFRERSLDGDGSGWDAYLRYSALTIATANVHRENGCADHAIVAVRETYNKLAKL